jgi:hypothetical protein
MSRLAMRITPEKAIQNSFGIHWEFIAPCYDDRKGWENGERGVTG